MSTINQTAGPSRSTDNFTAIFQAALDEYHTVTGKSLDTQPFATQLDDCNSPEAFSSVLRTQAQAFSKSRKGDEKLMAWLDPTINILCTFSGTLGEGIGLVSQVILFVSYHRSPTSGHQAFSPAKTIFTGVGVLLAVGFCPASRVTYMQYSIFTGSEGCCGKLQHPYPHLRAHSLFPSTFEELFRDATLEGLYGVAREDYGTNRFHPRTFDKGNDKEADE